jgi:hypothetical protein
MKFRLGDEGTLDTVIVCGECGAELRYNYDDGPRDEQDDEDRRAELRISHPIASEQAIELLLGEQLYDEFVAWAIEDAEDSHICGEDE